METHELIEASLQTDQGRIRDHNEDFVTFWEPHDKASEAQNGWLYIVADGVGGADAGEVASQYASERVIEHYLNDNLDLGYGERLWRAMQAANTDLRQMVAERGDDSRMATTMVALIFQGLQVFIGNVGDSRGYHWRNGRIRQITKDQSLVAKLVEEGAITEEEAFNHPRKNVILYSLGSEKEPKIDIFEETAEPGDIFLLCSDGLTRHVHDEEIQEVLTHQEPLRASRILIDLANERGGEDNISVAVLRYDHQASVKLPPSLVAFSENEILTGTSKKTARRRMLFYTILLSLVQTILIILIWALLQA
ncbi:MAG: Stp1/IreP family PP2C-type Ser/Thr phosphatase [Ardenticatenaceae bacterium]|nr:Stp1/IreP family PP2C-type Ser/Thr phosphatase [Ardenticatenaceae bacterium]MCB9446252.1 Stp1/IreP family PP2C-type Ser/Thr phosphatase [Ardenticatenaceae bacterium]